MRLRLLSAVATAVALALPASASAAIPTAVVNYTTPGTYTFKVPTGVTSIDVVVVGGVGQDVGSPGGSGATINGTIAVTPGAIYTLVVGLGGGSGGRPDGGTGGGYSGILLPNDTPIVIAGGGGAGSTGTTGASGSAGNPGSSTGVASGTAGAAGGAAGAGQPGTAAGPGAGGDGAQSGSPGAAGSGRNGGAGGAANANIGFGGGGGGGGYYGGGGGGGHSYGYGAGGGGGASYVSSSLTNVSSSLTRSAPGVRISFPDNVAPVVSIDQPSAVNPTTITGTGGIDGGDRPFVTVEFFGTTGLLTTVPVFVSTTDGSFSVDVPPLERGPWRVRAQQFDAAGNSGASTIYNFQRVDTPTITWPTPDPITYGSALSAAQLNATASVAGTFSYSPALGTVLDAGADQDLKVTFTPDDTTNYTVATKTVKLTVNKAKQTVDFPLPDGVFLNSAPITLTASATSGGPVTFSLISGPCTLDGNVVTIQRANNSFPDTCEIHADQAGTNNYKPATNIGLLYIKKLKQKITFPRPADGRVGDDPVELSASSDAGLAVEFSAGGSCTVSGNRLTFVKVGSCLVYARQGGNSTYDNALIVDHFIDVSKGTPKLTWPAPDSITYGDALSTTQLNATAPVDGTFSYSPALGTVLNAGADQELKVTFTPADTTNYDPATKTVKLTVNKASQEITFDQPADATFGDDPVDLSATASSDLDVSFSVTGPCSISGAQLSFTGAGECTITASQDGDDNYLAADTVDRTITVGKGVVKVKWPTPDPITYGEALSTTQLNASAPIPGTFSYTPDEGTVLGGGADQKLSVRFTPEDTDNYETVEVITSIDVDRAPQEITFAQPADLVAGGEAQALTASASSKLAVAFAVTGPCTVAGGKVSATAAGSCQITATQPGDDNYLAAEPVVRTLTVAPKPVPQAEPVALLGATLGTRCVVGRKSTTTALALTLRTTGAPKLTFRLDRKRGSRGRTRCPKANANYVAESRWAGASVENAASGELVSGTAARATARRAAVASATATATLPANLKPGRYRLTITTTAGTQTTSIPLYLWVLKPKKR